MNAAISNQFVPLYTNYTNVAPLQPVARSAPIPVRQSLRTGTLITTITIASALGIGSNMVAVKNGDMTISQAVLNGTVKGTAATVILNATARKTALQVITAAGVLAGAGFLIEMALKKDNKPPHAVSMV